ncbi:MAG: FAD-dependent oxidoreductase [Acetivibrionales bacterium]|jgi:heterodisulfide reductase subunit A
MAHNLIIGGGLAGCTIARELANSGQEVTIIEKTENIGGKVRHYGCKATSKCSNCGLCLVGSLWEDVEADSRVRIITEAELKDVIGSKGNFTIVYSRDNKTSTLEGVTNIVVSTGFQDFSQALSGNLEFYADNNIIRGSDMESILFDREKEGFLNKEINNVAFIQCFGSRDIQQRVPYCSRVCCAYSTRMARVLRYFYPEVGIVFFYMDLQKVEEGSYYNYLKDDQNIEFIRCRPAKFEAGTPCSVVYEEPGSEGLTKREFDLVILSEGIYPSEDNDVIAELCMLGIDNDGFLKYVGDSNITGVYLAGCASGPKRIEEVYTESLEVARQLISSCEPAAVG